MTENEIPQPPSTDPASIEETSDFTPRFSADGLIPAIAVDHATGDVLMLAYMDERALQKTLATREAHYWSRSRKTLWRKGETSGHTQQVIEVRTDCDQDAILLFVKQTGPACHTDRRSCFYRSIDLSGGVSNPVLRTDE